METNKNFKNFDEKKANIAFQKLLKEQYNHSKTYDPFVVLQSSKVMDTALEEHIQTILKNQTQF